MKNTEGPKFHIDYKKTGWLDLKYLEEQYEKNRPPNEELEYNPYKIDKLQKYNCIYSQFFEMNDTNFNQISLNHKYDMINLETIRETEVEENKQSPVFIKFSPLLDPTRYMVGKYDLKNDNLKMLPSIKNKDDCHPKLFSIHNASYVDCFFSYLSSMLLNHHSMIHGVDFYGSYLGIQSKFKVDISDDLEYLYNSPFFNNHLNKLFTITKSCENPFMNFGSRTNKNRLKISKNITLGSVISIEEVEDIEKGETIENIGDIEKVEDIEEIKKLETFGGEKKIEYSKEETGHSVSNTTASSSDSSNDSELNYSSDDKDDENCNDDNDEEDDDDNYEDIEDDSDDSDDEEEEEEEIYCYINNFPIQMICLEKCDGTMDELFEKELLDDITSASALFQIIMTLLIYQKVFHFTHNDLHTNNIMYKNTKAKYIYYCYKGIYYKVPTHGKIFKIIDFGRGIYTFQKKLFCSDSFSSTGDATTQYNFGPFNNEKKPLLEPNYSFDLCRLGCSIYDFIIDDDNKYEDLDEFQKTIYRWCTDDNGKNILYMKNGEERYPNFKLYKMIARTVHNHTPEKQLEFSFFNQFSVSPKTVKKIKEMESQIIDIDKIPSYV